MSAELSPIRSQRRSPVAPASDEQSAIERHLREHGLKYVAGGAGATSAHLLRFSKRDSARLYWYRVQSGEAGRNVVVKLPGLPADIQKVGYGGRPRLANPPPLDVKYEREYRGLDLLQRQIGALNDPRFGVVPVLDRIDPLRAIVMGEVVGRPLIQLLPQLSWVHPRRPSATLRNAVITAGAWLKSYHQLEPEGSMDRQARRADVVTLVEKYCAHLGKELSRERHFAALADRLTSAAERLLPDELPLALAHGDFAMRNVLVTATGQAVVLDTLAVWRAPIFEDLAKFGLAMRFARMQVYSQGIALSERRLRAADDWLHAGYFGDARVPHEEIRLYSAVLLLDKWTFELSRLTSDRPVLPRARSMFVNAWCGHLMRDLLAELA